MVAGGILEVVDASFSALEEDFHSSGEEEGILEPVVDNWEGSILVYRLEVVQDISVLEENNLDLDTFAEVDNLVGDILEQEEDILTLGILAYILLEEDNLEWDIL